MILSAIFKRIPGEVKVVNDICNDIVGLTGVIERYNKYHKAKTSFNEPEWIEALQELSEAMKELQQEIETLKSK